MNGGPGFDRLSSPDHAVGGAAQHHPSVAPVCFAFSTTTVPLTSTVVRLPLGITARAAHTACSRSNRTAATSGLRGHGQVHWRSAIFIATQSLRTRDIKLGFPEISCRGRPHSRRSARVRRAAYSLRSLGLDSLLPDRTVSTVLLGYLTARERSLDTPRSRPRHNYQGLVRSRPIAKFAGTFPH